MKGFNLELSQHTIEIEPNAKLVRKRQRLLNPNLEHLMKVELSKLIESSIIFLFKHTSWVSNLILVRNKIGKIRLCVDFIELNRASLKDHYPLPSMEHILQVVSKSKRFPLLDGFLGCN